jgi:hypothetical protein
MPYASAHGGRPEGATDPDDESERGDMTALRVCLPPVTPMEEQHG